MTYALPRRLLLALCLITVLDYGARGALDAAPTIQGVSQHGLQSGKANTLSIRGADLLPTPQLFLGDHPISATFAADSKTDQLNAKISLPEDFPFGIYLLRVATPDGISTGVPVAVDSLPQIAPVERLSQMPVAISGTLSGEQVFRTKVKGKRGERISIEVEARRLMSPLQPIIRLYDARGVQLNWASSARSLLRDARLTMALPEDGEYTIELHDAAYQAPSGSRYRLKVGEWNPVDVIFPLAVEQGKSAKVELIAAGNQDALSVEVAAPARSGLWTPPWPADKKLSGLQQRIIVSDHEELLEKDAGSNPQGTVPAGLNGRITKAGEEDRYPLTVVPGQKLSFDVQAVRHGSPLDAVLTIYDSSGEKALASNDDRPHVADPGIDFVVPDNTTTVVVGVRDALERFGPEYVYRVGVTPKVDATFSMTLPGDTLHVKPLGQALLTVDVQRKGYEGPIELELQGLPAGVTASNTRIAADSRIGRVLLTGNGEAQGTAMIRVLGHAVNGDAVGAVLAAATVAGNDLNRRCAWMQEQVPLTVVRPSPVSIFWGNTVPTTIPAGKSVAIQPRVVRRAGVTGPVRLSIVTNQPESTKTQKVNNVDTQVPDPDRVLRFEKEIVIPADQSTVSTQLVAPLNLATGHYQVLMRGELLSDDGQRVITSVFSEAIPLAVARPLSIEVANSDVVRIGAGTRGMMLKGRVIRQPGFDQPLRVVLTGLPDGLPYLFQDLDGSQSEFSIRVHVPYDTNRKKTIEAQLVAVTLESDRSKEVRSNSVPVKIQPGRGSRPAIEPAQRIFDDEATFVQQLTEGGGQSQLEEQDRYSGTASLLILPDQRFNAKIPDMQIKIRENPSPGEFRYLRYAWKKEGGTQICLQLAHDGKFGPAGPLNKPFRYHAGSGQCADGSLSIAAALPDQWTVVTRDLYADFGEFTLTGLGFSAVDGQEAQFDFLYLGRAVEDLNAVEVKK